MSGFTSEEIETVFFDVDDTLFDQRRAHRLALKEIKERCSEHFHGVDYRELVEAFERADQKSIEDFREGVPLNEIREERSEDMLRELSIDVSFSEELTELFYEIYPSMECGMKGVEEVVKGLHGDRILGVITNSSKEVQMRKLKTLEIIDHFETLVFSEEIGYRKPDGRIFLEALGRVDCKPQDCLYVGDSYRSDVVGASRVGMHTCWLNLDGRADGDVEPDVIISELTELLEYL